VPDRFPVARRCRAAATLLVVVALAAACTDSPSPGPRPDWHPAPVVDGAPLRAFTPDSWWNSALPRNAPSNPDADAILNYMSTEKQAGGGCLRLAGAGGSSWGQPVYWAGAGDPEYHVRLKGGNEQPELRHLRIPADARSAQNNDGSMTVFDVDRGYTVAFTDAAYDDGSDTWSASGATVTYLDSNGLDVRTGQASDDRNVGNHRGNNAAVMMARLDEVKAGAIDHVLKVASGPEVSSRHVFPMVGSDGGSRDPSAPPQGLRFRIRPSVDLEALGLDRQALVIAKALQKYGFYIGDSSGVTALKVEDTRTEGRGQLWETSPTALCALPFTPQFWDVLPEAYQPPPPA
jgi:hypothetical protein